MNERTLESDFREENAKHRFSFERLLVRLVPAVADPAYDPAIYGNG